MSTRAILVPAGTVTVALLAATAAWELSGESGCRVVCEDCCAKLDVAKSSEVVTARRCLIFALARFRKAGTLTTGGVSDAVTRPLQKAQGAGHPLFIWEKFFEIYFSATGRGTWRFD